ncbi:MAG: 3'-5' exonuclease [Bacteroidota bacterium]|nr:3'-5' exonuclease [Bacteroidota bacterium]
MQLTQEQYKIIHSTGNIKINAVAGSGKTTTIIEYAKTRPVGSRILYLAFNRSVKTDAIRKFAERGLKNATVETAHSLAHKYVVRNSSYKVRSQEYKTYELVEILGLKGTGDRLSEYIIANHILKFVAYFCNSDKCKVQELNYLDTVYDSQSRAFVKLHYRYIEKKTWDLLKKMDQAEIEISHDFYLKKFQLSNPQLPYDYILFDEGQDASVAMLDIFIKQASVKVIVGDTHQQIYGWRYAVNSLEKVDYQTYYLSKSFRFSQDIADLAMCVLGWKGYVSENIDEKVLKIEGVGTSKEIKNKAVLARTNLGLLLKAIEYVTEKKTIQHIYFEGNINSYTYADDGTSLYDVLNLYNHKHYLIKDKLIRTMHDIDDLVDYIKKTEDVQLGMMVEVVKEYGNDIPDIIKTIKEKHVGNEEKEKAEMIFSTIHRCKGMEYDAVQIVNDFMREEELKNIKIDKNTNDLRQSKLLEEINLLYVAVTRTRNSIYIPRTLIPSDFSGSAQVHPLRVKEQENNESDEKTTDSYHNNEIEKSGKSYTLEGVRLIYNDAYRPWTIQLDEELRTMYFEGISIKDMAKHFGRSKGAIRSRIKKLEL